MAFKKLTNVSLTDLFVDEIEKMILSGQLKPGDKLPPERQLAQEMDVSLAVINAGVMRLTALGFLNIVPRKGTYVADYVRCGNMDTMKEVIELTGLRIDDDVLDPIVRFRLNIETGAIKAACRMRDDKDIQTLESLIRQLEEDESSDLPEIGFTFHHEIAMSSKNICYPMLIQSCKPLYLLFYRMVYASSGHEIEVNFLKHICQAVKDRDDKAAIEAVKASIDYWADFMNHIKK